MREHYEGFTVEKATEAIGVIAEFCFEAIRHNESHGVRQAEQGAQAHFGPNWNNREIAQIVPYPDAFGIDKDRGVDLEKLGIPVIDEDGDISTKWYESKGC